MMSKVIKTLKNEYIFALFNKFFNIFIGLLQSILVARYLGAELKGINTYISSITSIGSIIITFGMHQAYPYFRKKFGKDYIYKDYVSLTMILYLIYFLIALSLAYFLNTTIQVKAAIILIPLLGYSRVTAYIALIEYPNVRNKWWTIVHIIDVLYVYLLWKYTTRNLYFGISILLFADLLKCIVYTLILKVKPHLNKNMTALLKELVKYGFFPMIALLMTTLNYRIDVLMLHEYNYITDSMIGIYSLGISLSEKIVLIPDTLKGILASKLAKGANHNEVAKISRISLWASLAFCLSIFVFGKSFINTLYGAEYSDAYIVIMITAAGVLAVSFFKYIAQYNIINKKQYLNVALLSIAIIVDIVFNLLFIPIWGINGAALATCLGNIVCGIVFIIYFCRKTGVWYGEMFFLQKKDIDIIKAMLNRNKEVV